MYHGHNETWEKRIRGRNRTAKSEKNKNAWRVEKLLILGNIGSWHHQTEMKEKNKKSEPQTNEKTSRNQAI